MQTDDIFILVSEEFLVLEDDKFREVKFLAKPKEALVLETLLIFNRCVLTQYKNTI